MTITHAQRSAVSTVLKQIADETKAGHPVTHSANWQRCGEALGYTGEEATAQGRKFVEALATNSVKLSGDINSAVRTLKSGSTVTRYNNLEAYTVEDEVISTATSTRGTIRRRYA